MLPYRSMDITNKTYELRQQNSHRVESCLNIAADYFNRHFDYQHIHYNLVGRAAGQLVSQRILGKIQRSFRFNAHLLDRYHLEFIEQVVPHECAHLVAYEMYGKNIKPHGQEWQYVMREVFKLEAQVTHSFEVEPARVLRQFEYFCACQDRRHWLSTIRHNKVVKGKGRYLCRACHTELSRMA